MKKIILFILTGLMLVLNAEGQTKNASMKVAGNCDRCKARIEKTALKVNGVKAAVWDESSKLLVISYASEEAVPAEVEKAINFAGHDTEKNPADENAFSKLPNCCQFERYHVAQAKVQTVRFSIGGMTCAEGCAKGIENALYKLKGVKSSEVDYEQETAKVVYDTDKVSVDTMIKTIESFNPKGESNKYIVRILP